MKSDRFCFAGYLLQEPCPTDIPDREMFQLATLDLSLRFIHDGMKTPKFEEAQGFVNATEFVFTPPPPIESFELCGYAIDRTVIDSIKSYSIKRDGTREQFTDFEYARYLSRSQDGLEVLGYEVIDGIIHHLSILHNCGLGLEEIEDVSQSRLNTHGLFDNVEAAEKLISGIQASDPMEPHFELPVIWQVLGAERS